MQPDADWSGAAHHDVGKPVPSHAFMHHILLVEDNELNRDALTRRLEKRGYLVVHAPDGARALALALTEAPDLILMDLGLPDIDGWSCARPLKASPATRGIPIIALSAHAMRGDRERALEAGCDEFDTKPVDLPALLDKMTRLIGERDGLESV